jgi:hypothetical protein
MQAPDRVRATVIMTDLDAAAAAVTVVRPGVSASSRPSAPTRATRGADEVQRTTSSRSSPSAASTRARRVTRCPARSRDTGGSTSTRAARGATMRTRTSVGALGGWLGTRAIASTTNTPRAPPRTIPLCWSTAPSNPRPKNRTSAESTGRPALSSAVPRRRTESPAAITASAGSTTIRATGCGAWAPGCCHVSETATSNASIDLIPCGFEGVNGTAGT